MTRQTRFETKTFRGCEIRLQAGQRDTAAPWMVKVDVYDRTGAKTRILGRSQGWPSWQQAVLDGFQLGRDFVNTSLSALRPTRAEFAPVA